jgi:signal transduction histidine kinase
VSVRGEEDEVELRVHNWGKPIDADDLNMLFDAFRRGRGAAQRTRGGLGLGLFVVDQVMRAHGGRVEVRSSVAEGTTFTTHWPRRISTSA